MLVSYTFTKESSLMNSVRREWDNERFGYLWVFSSFFSPLVSACIGMVCVFHDLVGVEGNSIFDALLYAWVITFLL